MTDYAFTPAPFVEQALQSLRGTSLPASPIPADTTAAPAPAPAPPPNRVTAGAAPGTADVAPLHGARNALRTVSASAQTRLAKLEDLPALPSGRDLSDLGPYVEHVMREAQAAAIAYRTEAEREASARATKILDAAAAAAQASRQDADAYRERTVSRADALLAARVRRIAKLTARLAQMAQLAGDEARDDQMRAQMTEFIAGLTVVAETTIADVFADAAAA